MKKLIAITALLIAGCSDTPTTSDLLEDNYLMSVLLKAASTYDSGYSQLPIAIDVSRLVANRLISSKDVASIKKVTNCDNLEGLTLSFANGQITGADVDSDVCAKED